MLHPSPFSISSSDSCIGLDYNLPGSHILLSLLAWFSIFMINSIATFKISLWVHMPMNSHYLMISNLCDFIAPVLFPKYNSAVPPPYQSIPTRGKLTTLTSDGIPKSHPRHLLGHSMPSAYPRPSRLHRAPHPYLHLPH